MIKPTIKNLTSVPFHICKACPKTLPILPNENMVILPTMKAFCHGHSSIGSFVIARKTEKIFEYKCWGNVELRSIVTKDSCAFEIVEKN